jgi:hypothetical protein
MPLAPSEHEISKWFKALPALGQGADLATTMIAKKKGLYETNPILDNNKKIIASKIGMALLGTLLTNHYEKKHPKIAKTISVLTGASGAVPAFINSSRMFQR